MTENIEHIMVVSEKGGFTIFYLRFSSTSQRLCNGNELHCLNNLLIEMSLSGSDSIALDSH